MKRSLRVELGDTREASKLIEFSSPDCAFSLDATAIVGKTLLPSN